MIGQPDKLRIQKISDLVYKASRKIRILGYLNWPVSVRYKFFRSRSEHLPEVYYPRFDSSFVKENLKAAKDLLGDTPVDDWLKKKIHDVESGVTLLQHCGTKKFFQQSVKIYGQPREKLRDGKSTPLDLAKHLRSVLNSQSKRTGNLSAGTLFSLEDIQKIIGVRVNKVFRSFRKTNGRRNSIRC